MKKLSQEIIDKYNLSDEVVDIIEKCIKNDSNVNFYIDDNGWIYEYHLDLKILKRLVNIGNNKDYIQESSSSSNNNENDWNNSGLQTLRRIINYEEDIEEIIEENIEEDEDDYYYYEDDPHKRKYDWDDPGNTFDYPPMWDLPNR